MNDLELDRVLSGETQLVPSSGFVSSVMDAVQRDAVASSLPIPWTRALPALAAWSIALAATIWMIVERSDRLAQLAPDAQRLAGNVMQAAASNGWGWVVLALLLSCLAAIPPASLAYSASRT